MKTMVPLNIKKYDTVEAAYAPGSQLVPARQQYPVLQHRCTLCTVPAYEPLCMQ